MKHIFHFSILFSLALTLFSLAPARAASGVIAPSGRAVHYQFWRGEPGKPVYVCANGLIYMQEWWGPLLARLNKEGASILWYSYSADPLSLALPSRPDALPITVPGIADEIASVLKDAGVTKVTLLTLSYGSVATEFAVRFPQLVDRVVMMAPMIVPADRYNPAGQASRVYLNNVRTFWGEAAYEQQWRMTQEPTVRSLVHRRISDMKDYVPQGVSIARAVDGAIEKIKATRDFDLRGYSRALRTRVDVILASEEEPLQLADQKDFWARLPDGVRGSLILVRKAEHALPASAPDAALAAIAMTRDRAVQAELSADGKLLR